MNLLKYQILLIVVMVMFSGAVLAQDSWIKYKADAVLSFEVDVPTEFVIKNKKMVTAVGELDARTYAIEGKEDDPNYLYAINVIEYPYGVFPEDSVELIDIFLDEAIQSLGTGVKGGGEVVYSSDLSEKENGQGKIFRIKFDDEYSIIKGKAFLKDGVFITLQVYTTKEKSLNPEMDDFLESFKMKF